MGFSQETSGTIKIEPAPEFSDIGFAGDGRIFFLNGNEGGDGIVPVYDGPGALPYDNNKIEIVDGLNYSKFYCDFLITQNLKLQGAGVNLSGGEMCDFIVSEILYLTDPDNDTWVLAKRFVKRFYISTDAEKQNTPDLPYSKSLASNRFIVRTVYYKHETNLNDVIMRLNYLLHEITEVV